MSSGYRATSVEYFPDLLVPGLCCVDSVPDVQILTVVICNHCAEVDMGVLNANEPVCTVDWQSQECLGRLVDGVLLQQFASPFAFQVEKQRGFLEIDFELEQL